MWACRRRAAHLADVSRHPLTDGIRVVCKRFTSGVEAFESGRAEGDWRGLQPWRPGAWEPCSQRERASREERGGREAGGGGPCIPAALGSWRVILNSSTLSRAYPGEIRIVRASLPWLSFVFSDVGFASFWGSLQFWVCRRSAAHSTD